MVISSGICSVRFCRKKRKRAGKYYFPKCSMHTQREYVKNHPERAYLHHLRKSAKKRGIECTITFEELAAFLKGKNFFAKTGLKKNSATIDRVESHRGYAAGNLQIVTRSHNSQKYWSHDRHYRFDTVTDVGEVDLSDCPF